MIILFCLQCLKLTARTEAGPKPRWAWTEEPNSAFKSWGVLHLVPSPFWTSFSSFLEWNSNIAHRGLKPQCPVIWPPASLSEFANSALGPANPKNSLSRGWEFVSVKEKIHWSLGEPLWCFFWHFMKHWHLRIECLTAIDAVYLLQSIKFILNKHGWRQLIMLEVCGTSVTGVSRYFLIGLKICCTQ